jgi:hypothetical protein
MRLKSRVPRAASWPVVIRPASRSTSSSCRSDERDTVRTYGCPAAGARQTQTGSLEMNGRSACSRRIMLSIIASCTSDHLSSSR